MPSDLPLIVLPPDVDWAAVTDGDEGAFAAAVRRYVADPDGGPVSVFANYASEEG